MRKEIMVGMNFPGNVRAENLERELQQIVDNGFDYVEYNLSDLPLICTCLLYTSLLSCALSDRALSGVPTHARDAVRAQMLKCALTALI